MRRGGVVDGGDEGSCPRSDKPASLCGGRVARPTQRPATRPSNSTSPARPGGGREATSGCGSAQSAERAERIVSEYYEVPRGSDGSADPVRAGIESGARRILADDGALPPAFFDLSTGVAGGIVQRLTQYEIRMATVVPDVSAHSGPFQDFAREANHGRWFRFFPDRGQALAWLLAEQADGRARAGHGSCGGAGSPDPGTPLSPTQIIAP
jgi:hypothetical protein